MIRSLPALPLITSGRCVPRSTSAARVPFTVAAGAEPASGATVEPSAASAPARARRAFIAKRGPTARTRYPAVFLGAAVLALAGAWDADATIRPQRGIAGVSLGMNAAQVRKVLGPPTIVRRGSTAFGPYREFRYRGLRVFFQGVRAVTSITTTRRTERTPSGVGVGSSERELRRRIRRARCRTEFRVRRCVLGRFLPGERVTEFRLRRGRVAEVTVGLVID